MQTTCFRTHAIIESHYKFQMAHLKLNLLIILVSNDLFSSFTIISQFFHTFLSNTMLRVMYQFYFFFFYFGVALLFVFVCSCQESKITNFVLKYNHSHAQIKMI